MIDVEKLVDSMIDVEHLVELISALHDWADDFDTGWGDRGASGDEMKGGYSQHDHSNDHTVRAFRLLRAIEAAAPRSDRKWSSEMMGA